MKTYHSLSLIQSSIRSAEISCYSLTQDYLNRIEKNRDLNAFLEVFESEALERAKQIDLKFKKGTAGKLAGMVIGVKDNICIQGHKVSASSKILEGFESLYSATVIDRLIEEDAIIIGRLNCDEFAMGSANENSAYGPVLNPHNKSKVPGGSSGGSAAAVAANLCLAALGSDTGGSIRQPASFCGVVGLKPTYGRVSRWGLVAYASSFDQIGPLTHTVEDAALLLEVMAGKDDKDSTVSNQKAPKFSASIDNKAKYKIGYLKSCLDSPSIDVEVKNHAIATIEHFKSDGHQVEAVDFPYLDYLTPTYYVLSTAEASSNLARFDGIHYGYRSSKAKDIPTTYKKSRSEGFGVEVKRRIMLGTFVLSAGYYDAYYTKAQQVRRMLKDKTDELFKEYDLLFLPTSPHTAFEIDKKFEDPTQAYLEDIFTVYANIVGAPAISLPTGRHTNGMPFGMQLMAAPYAEEKLLSFSYQVMNSQKFQ